MKGLVVVCLNALSWEKKKTTNSRSISGNFAEIRLQAYSLAYNQPDQGKIRA
jgi:hypothetical protein